MQTQTADFTLLCGAKYISLTTFRKSGEPVATPVWFAQDDDVLYLFTFPGAGKLKRIRHTARVTVAPCTLNGKVTGPSVEAQAHILTGEQAEARADQILAHKYGLTWRIYHAVMGTMRVLSRKPKSVRVYVAIEPAG
jgi:PPOX class probable F420-dependent enzyme